MNLEKRSVPCDITKGWFWELCVLAHILWSRSSKGCTFGEFTGHILLLENTGKVYFAYYETFKMHHIHRAIEYTPKYLKNISQPFCELSAMLKICPCVQFCKPLFELPLRSGSLKKTGQGAVFCVHIKWQLYQQEVKWKYTNNSRLTYLVFHLQASVVQLFLSKARRGKTLFEPLLFLRSFCRLSLSLSHCPVFRPLFYFFLLCSSRVALSGPVLPETPGTSPLSIFSTFPFRLLSPSLSLLTLPLSAQLSIPHTSKRLKREAILNQAQRFSFSLYWSISI